MVGRGDLTDTAWATIAPLLPENGGRGQQWRDHRQVLNGILWNWKLRTGAPGRDLPDRYGPWRTVYDQVIHERVEERVLSGPATVAGVQVTVVDVMEYEHGELTEHTLDYYAQHRDGTVYYLGEDVDMYEDGEIVGHEGAWRAGEGESVAGVFLPADPAVGGSSCRSALRG